MNAQDPLQFAIAYSQIPQVTEKIWDSLARFLEKNRCLPAAFEVLQEGGPDRCYDSTERLKLTPADIARTIAKRGLDGFFVHTSYSHPSVEYHLRFGQRGVSQSVFTCQIDPTAKSPPHWMPLVEELMAMEPTIGAWQYSRNYGRWQGSSRIDLGYDQVFGPIPPGFRRWHEPSCDGIGAGMHFLDISLNPGRPKEILPTISFLPTAEMWLGPHFWQYAKCTKEEALAADFFIEKRDTPDFLYLKCWPTAFTRPDGEQGRMQQRLWKLFFHEDCEWPPGSGTICDEPMYGPPELMPETTNKGASAADVQV